MTENMKNTLAELARLTVENADLKVKVNKLEATIERAHFELSLEDVNPDDCRADVLAILKPTHDRGLKP